MTTQRMEKQPVTDLIAMLDYAQAKLADFTARVSQLEAGKISNYITDMQAHEAKIADAKYNLETWKSSVERLRTIIEDRIKDTTGL